MERRPGARNQTSLLAGEVDSAKRWRVREATRGTRGEAPTRLATLATLAPRGRDEALNPPLQLARRQMAYHRHAGLAVVEAGERGEALAAVVTEDLGVLDRDLLQRLEA